MKINKSNQLFFQLLRAGLWADVDDSTYAEIVDDADWSNIYRLAEEQSVIGLIAEGIDRFKLHVPGFSIPQEWALQFIGQTLQIEQRNRAMDLFVAILINRLRKADVYALLVKGQGVAQCYERPLWRASGDVDLLLSEDNYEKAKKLLIPMATSSEEEFLWKKHLGLTIENWVVELHGRLHCGLSPKIERELGAVQYDTFYGGQVRSWMNGKTQVFLLKAENDAFYVFTHILQHFYKGGIGLRQICDWCRLLWTYRDTLDVRLLESRIRKAGLVSEWKAFYALAVKYLGMPDLDVGLMVHDSRFDKKADRIMNFILMSGNFGHNRDTSYMKYPYLVRKFYSMRRRIGDLYRHARIFPLDSLRFSFAIMGHGLRSAVRGE